MIKNSGGLADFFLFYGKLIILFFYLVYVLFLFNIKLSKFKSDDPGPKVQLLSFEQRKLYSEFSSQVRTGFFIKNFSVLNMSKNNFVIDAAIWFEFDGSQLSLDVIDRFLFNNAKIIKKSSPDLKVVKDKLQVTYQVTIDLKSDLKFQNYPFTDHSVNIVLVNNSVAPSEMYFYDDEKHSFAVSESMFDASWGVHSTKMQAGVIIDEVANVDAKKKLEYPCIAFTVNFIKKSYKDLFVLFMPIFAALLFSLISLFMDLTNDVGRFTLSISAVTALLGYRFVIEQMSPRDGSFTILDKFYLVFLGVAFLVFVFHIAMTGLLYSIDKSKDSSEKKLIDRDVVTYKKRLKVLQDCVFFVFVIFAYMVTLYLIFY